MSPAARRQVRLAPARRMNRRSAPPGGPRYRRRCSGIRGASRRLRRTAHAVGCRGCRSGTLARRSRTSLTAEPTARGEPLEWPPPRQTERLATRSGRLKDQPFERRARIEAVVCAAAHPGLMGTAVRCQQSRKPGSGPGPPMLDAVMSQERNDRIPLRCKTPKEVVEELSPDAAWRRVKW